MIDRYLCDVQLRSSWYAICRSLNEFPRYRQQGCPWSRCSFRYSQTKTYRLFDFESQTSVGEVVNLLPCRTGVNLWLGVFRRMASFSKWEPRVVIAEVVLLTPFFVVDLSFQRPIIRTWLLL